MAREQQDMVYEQQNKKRSIVSDAGQDKQPQILLPTQLQATHMYCAREFGRINDGYV